MGLGECDFWQLFGVFSSFVMISVCLRNDFGGVFCDEFFVFRVENENDKIHGNFITNVA